MTIYSTKLFVNKYLNNSLKEGNFILLILRLSLVLLSRRFVVEKEIFSCALTNLLSVRYKKLLVFKGKLNKVTSFFLSINYFSESIFVVSVKVRNIRFSVTCPRYKDETVNPEKQNFISDISTLPVKQHSWVHFW